MITANNKKFLSKYGSIDQKNILVNDPDPFIRKNVALDPKLDESQLHKLSKDWHSLVRESVANNPSATSEHLDILMKNHPQSFIKEAIVKHQNASKEQLEILSKDDMSHIKINARNRLDSME